MNHSAVQLAGSSDRIFRAWQVLRQSQAGSNPTGKKSVKRERSSG